MRVLIGAMLVYVVASTPVSAEEKSLDERLRERQQEREKAKEVFFCTDTNVAGLVWDKKNPQGDGRVQKFNGFRYTMRINSKTARLMTITAGGRAGREVSLQRRFKPASCNPPKEDKNAGAKESGSNPER